MKMSNRQRQIAALLTNRPDGITVAEIAESVRVSARTVHRELQDIETALSGAGIALLRKSGSGLALDAEPEKLDAFRRTLKHADAAGLGHSAQERKVLTILRLIEESEPTKLFALAHELQAAIPTISHDLDEWESLLTGSGLALERRRGYGVELQGSERAIRRFIFRLARQFLDPADLFEPADDAGHSPIRDRLLEMIGLEGFFRVEKALWRLEEQHRTKLSEESYTLLVLRLAIALSRYLGGRIVDAMPAEPTPRDAERAQAYARFLDADLPERELAYAAHLLSGWDASEQVPVAEHFPQIEIVVELVAEVENLLGASLMRDRSLIEGLLHHMEPVLQRIREGQQIRNPLLLQIKRDYAELYEAVREAAARKLSGYELPEEEIGFLTMHFGAALERANLLTVPVRALLVCTSGIGSSKMLAVRITKELPQIELIGRVSWFEAVRTPPSDYDLIISTVDLPIKPERYIKLSPLLTAEETERLRKFVHNLAASPAVARDETSLAKPSAAPSELNAIARLAGLRDHALEAHALIERFDAISLTWPLGTEFETILHAICGYAFDIGALTDTAPVVDGLLERERHGSQLIPDTELALVHTRSDAVRFPLLLLFRLDHPVALSGGAGARQLLLMLAPIELSKSALAILSEISALLLLPETMALLEDGDTEQIRVFLAGELEHVIKSKMDWRV
ncbi:BglG family transcription antiterminator [Paenibacillus methanolicus]|uniref:Mannitol operon transcriptional antiterminator n=1 Tax=Paenibacillus methanolicus TaxID=582686 RepID=A0A5S5CIQ3_9BACL|nr:BglG family transcription antiterminator [Paenibacillus methanolicus]TYP79630.1 mannitol operon transcriptional antiterminator [Paenibacillus methanolicus]